MNEVRTETGAHHLLESLNALGIEYLFCNLGTDHAPLIEEMARWRQQNRQLPKIVLCPHENTALHMAAGYAAATGRGQGVLVHVDAGTANSAMALHNLFRARIPVLLMAGKAPFSTNGELKGGRDSFVHFIQEPYDQGSVVRPYVKWEYTLPAPELTHEVVARAHTVMHSDPMGPTYLMLPREVLAARAPALPSIRRRALESNPVKVKTGDPDAIDQVAERLLAAEDPLLVTAYAGRNLAVPHLLDELAQLTGLAVYEFNTTHLNISHDSPCYAGGQPGPHVERTDFGILLDVDVPWIPRDIHANPDAYWVQMDVDVLKRDMPLWSFPTDLRVPGDSHLLLQQLLAAVRAQQTPSQARRAAERVSKMRHQRAKQQAAVAARAESPGARGQINPDYFCAALGRMLSPDDIIINEAIRNAAVVQSQIPFTRPGTLLGSLAGGLGFSGGMALGQKLAQPDRTVVQIVGDGSFYFCNPSSVYAVAAQYSLPIFTIVLDNTGWGAVKASTLRMYPKGIAHVTDEFSARLLPDMQFAKVAEAAGAYGETLEDPAETEASIGRCLAALREGRSAVLHVRVAPM